MNCNFSTNHREAMQYKCRHSCQDDNVPAGCPSPRAVYEGARGTTGQQQQGDIQLCRHVPHWSTESQGQ